MDTKPLERFATQARRELLAAVDAQATAVLAPGSVARTERGEVVKRLEAEIAAHGRGHVIDKVAYTWFNRIIALRFMDACNYTDAGVVSPAQGQAHGQPEILADAKRGNLNTDVVSNKNTADAIIGLLDGTRRSTDAEGEAYALLLTEYCRYWHKSMPFMFEREGDYTELLVPTGLLADGATLSRAREVLTEEVCEDVEVIGWLYQFYISERKAEVFAGFQKNKKAGPEEIPAATQLFTPHWIVRYLVENSLGRLWMLNRPTSRLVDRMDYYIAPVDEETDFLTIAGPDELTVIDPACGSGHMLTYAFDLLYAIYEEEGYAPSEIPSMILTNNLHGTEIDPRAGSLAAFALTMKARAKQRTFFNKQIEPKICVIEPISFRADELNFLVINRDNRDEEADYWNQFEHADTLGSLIQPDANGLAPLLERMSHLSGVEDILSARTLENAKQVLTQATALSRKYAVVIANPPYMGAKNMDTRLADFARRHYSATKSDLFAMFIERCISLTAPHGATAMITMQSWMFLSSYEKLRKRVVENSPVNTMLHLGEKSFDAIGGSVVSTTAFVLSNLGDTSRRAIYVRAVEGQNEASKRETILKAASQPGAETWRTASIDLEKIPGAPIAYGLSAQMLSAFSRGRPLGSIASPKAGMHGGDVNRFARLWHEVAANASNYSASTTAEAHQDGRKWVGLNKGGSFRKWYGNQEYVIAFDRDTYNTLAKIGNKLPSREYYFLPSVSWSKVSSGAPAFRLYPQGFVFDVSGTPVFSSYRERLTMLGIGNSEMARVMLTAIAPTLNFEIGQVASLPILDLAKSDCDAARVETLVATSKEDWDSFETSWNFEASPIIKAHGNTQSTLAAAVDRFLTGWEERSLKQQALEAANNTAVAQLFDLEDEVPCAVPLERVTLNRNTAFRWPGSSSQMRSDLATQDAVKELVSYAVGCMFGRYSIDRDGLVLADQGATLQDYLASVPTPTFLPDADNVIPFVDDGWFEDDIVERFRNFMRTAFGEQHFEENMRFVEDSLGVKTLRDYFITKAGKSKFYDDHVQRYKKRPIYWMFSSPKGSFNALIYMHRYTPSTVSTVLNEYLREYRAKLEVALANAERAAAGGISAKDQKEADRLRMVLAELRDYEHDLLYPLATAQLVIDLDDGVVVNYLRFGRALRAFGLEKERAKVASWEWPKNRLEAAE